MMDKSQEIQ